MLFRRWLSLLFSGSRTEVSVNFLTALRIISLSNFPNCALLSSLFPPVSIGQSFLSLILCNYSVLLLPPGFSLGDHGLLTSVSPISGREILIFHSVNEPPFKQSSCWAMTCSHHNSFRVTWVLHICTHIDTQTRKNTHGHTLRERERKCMQ